MDGSDGPRGLTASARLDWPGPVGIPPSLHNETWRGLSAPEMQTAEISRNFYIPPPVRLSHRHTHTVCPTSLSIFLFSAGLLNACPYILEVLMQSLKLSRCSLNSTLFLCSAHKSARTHNRAEEPCRLLHNKIHGCQKLLYFLKWTNTLLFIQAGSLSSLRHRKRRRSVYEQGCFMPFPKIRQRKCPLRWWETEAVCSSCN